MYNSLIDADTKPKCYVLEYFENILIQKRDTVLTYFLKLSVYVIVRDS